MSSCTFCNKEGHLFTKCPMFGSSEDYIKACAPSTEQVVDPSGSTLAPTRLEELYGTDYDQVLMEAIDNDELSHEQHVLATEILIGTTDLKKLDETERSMLDELATEMATYSGKVKPQPKPIVRVKPPIPIGTEKEFGEGPRRPELVEPTAEDQKSSFFGGADPYSSTFTPAEK